MIEYHTEIVQGTEEWFRLRLGMVTASNINTILTPTGKPAKNEKMRSYACEIVAQREMPVIEDGYQSFDMIRGNLEEGIARDIYSDNFASVKEVGFITNSDHGFTIGCSPDGLVGEEGGIEIKSRQAKFQIMTIIADEVPVGDMNQVETFLLVSGRKWCDFIQYSNGMPLFCKRVFPDPERCAEILAALSAFESVMAEISEKYRNASSGMVKTKYIDLLPENAVGEAY